MMKSKLLKSAKDRPAVLTVEISDITPEQADEFRRLFGWLNLLGGYGCSRQFTLSYDGDGGARAVIKEDGKRLEPSEEDTEKHDATNFEKLRFGFE